MTSRKTITELQRENDNNKLTDSIIEKGHKLWAEHRVEDIVYGAVKIILILVLTALVGLVVYAAKG